MLPNALKVSYKALLSIPLSKFLMKMFPTPDRRRAGSRWDHMILIGRPFRLSKFMVSRALSAVCMCVWGERGGEGKRHGGHEVRGILKARRRVEKKKKERLRRRDRNTKT